MEHVSWGGLRAAAGIFAFGLLAALSIAQSTGAQSLPGVVVSFTGEFSRPTQEDRISFEVDGDRFGLTTKGTVELVFVLNAAEGSPVDPGPIEIVGAGGRNVEVGGPRRPDSPGITASIAIATLTPGAYDLLVRSERNTSGAYRLDVLLAGDANGDLEVDGADLVRIAELTSMPAREPAYSQIADVDRNGVIDGADRQRAVANLGASARPVNPLDQSLPVDALALVGVSANTFNPTGTPLRFSLVGAEFDLVAADVTLTSNGARVTADRLSIEDHLLSADAMLVEGTNDVSLKAYDTVGRPLYFNATLWAGSASLQVNLVNPDGSPFVQQATVIAALKDDTDVSAEAITATGTVVFRNVPSRTILIKAQGGNRAGSAEAAGSQGRLQLTMVGFGSPGPLAYIDSSRRSHANGCRRANGCRIGP